MRVVHVDSAGDWRGSQSQVLLAAQGMAACGHAVTLACRAEHAGRDPGSGAGR